MMRSNILDDFKFLRANKQYSVLGQELFNFFMLEPNGSELRKAVAAWFDTIPKKEVVLMELVY